MGQTGNDASSVLEATMPEDARSKAALKTSMANWRKLLKGTSGDTAEHLRARILAGKHLLRYGKCTAADLSALVAQKVLKGRPHVITNTLRFLRMLLKNFEKGISIPVALPSKKSAA
jgi:hypothetical protein